MTSLPPPVRPTTTTAQAPAPPRPWYRRVPRPTWVTAIFALLPLIVDIHVENMRTVNGQVVEYFRLDVFQVVAAAVLVLAFVAVLLRFRRDADPARRPPRWTIAVGAAGLAVGALWVVTAHTGLDGVTQVLAGH